ncbi:hypothetical protein PJX95_20490 [Serratia rubidaea]|uniref:hypothetical protein n=1 Tax=Serratia rubidaea TaxID=61652 RepID=UPI00234A01D9|nr:hypothetical protein [Serratia rubidaea]MDC6120423.1 hypothetical protein [Serratia rubidaea]
MILRIARWLFQLPGRLFGMVFSRRLTTFIFFMLVALGAIAVKRYLRTDPQAEPLSPAAQPHYDIQRDVSPREARGQCGGPLHDNQGSPWPDSAGYLRQPDAQERGRTQRITLDNQHNAFAVRIKLSSAENPQYVADLFIPAAASFSIQTSAAERYVMKVKNIQSGCSYRSQPFALASDHNWRLPISLHSHGKVQFQAIDAGQF